MNATNHHISDKVRMLKRSLKVWNYNEFGNIDGNIKKLENSIQHFDDLSNERDLDSQELELRKQAQTDLWQWIKRKELYRAQNSQTRWLKEGNRNTKFFHDVASNKRRKNTIGSIDTDGETMNDPSRIKSEAVNFFKNIFRDNFASRPVFEDLQFNQLSHEQATSLTQPFSWCCSGILWLRQGSEAWRFQVRQKCMRHHQGRYVQDCSRILGQSTISSWQQRGIHCTYSKNHQSFEFQGLSPN